MSPKYRLLTVAAAFFSLTGLASAQMAISAKAGMIHVADGEVYLADKAVELQPNSFPDIKEGQILRTAEGRAEVLLAPGTFLRMGEDSAFKMLNNRITDTRILVEKGSVLIEAMDLLDGNYMTFAVGDIIVNPQKEGLYLIEANPVRVRVYSGEARVSGGGQAILVKGGKELLPAGEHWAVTKFDENDTNALYRWSRRRSEYVAKANVSAARSAGNGMLPADSRGRWIYNSWLGMMTWLPYGNTMMSPFGYRYYTPYTVMRFYTPPPVYSGGGFGGSGGGGWERSIGGSYSGGWAGGGAPIRSAGGAYSGSTGGGSMGAAAPAPAPSAPAAGASAPVRGGEGSGGRGGSGGGRQ